MKSIITYGDKRKGLQLPVVLSEELAEFLGIMTGDGSINKYRFKGGTASEYSISITCSFTDDKEYIDNFIVPLIFRVFNIKLKPVKLKGQNTIRIITRSKGLFYFLKDIGFNIGPKDNIEIPKFILKNKKFIIPFIRGLFDTDGSVSLKKQGHNYPVISVKQKSRKLVEQLELILKEMGFSMYTEYDTIVNDNRGFSSKGSRIYINGRKNAKNWMGKIGFHNPKHIRKVEIAVGREGFEPSTA
ncbi:MAG: hypothetical protein J4400_04785 [Candidatus Aenigmarchaeota archaeon]|nr:hypothetical protein [Candidatus Aenigmarchaeota archaeon]